MTETNISRFNLKIINALKQCISKGKHLKCAKKSTDSNNTVFSLASKTTWGEKN